MAKLKCDVCEMQQASVYCEADEAYLCLGCDSTVHGANTLASRHKRVELEQRPAAAAASNDRACPAVSAPFQASFQGSLDFPPGGIRVGDITFARVSTEQPTDEEECHQVPRFVPVAQELPSLEPFRFHALATGEDLPRFNGKFMSLLGNDSGEAEPANDDASPVESVDLGVVPDLTQPSIRATTTKDKDKEPLKGIKADKEREARVNRYREKRRTRMFSKKIRYEVRKIYAENRPRLKGRFVRRTEWQQAPRFMASSSSSSSRWPKYQQRLRQVATRGKDTQWRHSSSLALGLLVVVVAAALYWSSGRSASLYSGLKMQGSRNSCNYSEGSWIIDEKQKLRPLYDESCSDIFSGWKCAQNGRVNAGEYLRWRWKPRDCDLPRFDPRYLLERLRGKRIGFVGDSISRNMYTSLVCSLKSVVGKQWRKERPIGSDKGVIFLEYNVTIAYHRTNLLARYGPWKASSNGGKLEKLGYQRGYRVDTDVPQSTWSQVPEFHDIIILNTGHWWFAPEKFHPGMLFFEGGQPILPPLLTEEGLELTVKQMLRYVEQSTGNRKQQLRYLRLQSPRHFEGGDWREGGTCHRSQPLTNAQVDDMFDVTRRAVNSEDRMINKHLVQAARGTSFRLLDVTTMSEFRADGHPSTSAGKRHEDCMHWCLPGVTDFWNDLLVADVLSKG